jgi:hypothetical protein
VKNPSDKVLKSVPNDTTSKDDSGSSEPSGCSIEPVLPSEKGDAEEKLYCISLASLWDVYHCILHFFLFFVLILSCINVLFEKAIGLVDPSPHSSLNMTLLLLRTLKYTCILII